MSDAVRIKICGVTSPADAALAARLGADAIGLNFYPPSPRCIDEAMALAILDELPPFIHSVGVFADEPLTALIHRAARLGRLQALQLHGVLPELIESFPHAFIAAMAVRDAGSLAVLSAYLDGCRARRRLPAAVLVDAYVPGELGGTGRTAPWDLLADFQPGVPLILAGGLTSDNVAAAIRRVRPYAVDVASGVERAPGRKDAEKMRRFIAAVREVS